MRYRVIHRTVYAYSEPVTVSHHVARLEPGLTAQQPHHHFDLRIEPEPAAQRLGRDYFGNPAHFFTIQQLHRRLEVVATSEVEIVRETPPVPGLSCAWERVVEVFRDPVSPDVVEPYQFVFDSPLVRASEGMADYARTSFPPGTPLLEGVLDLNSRINKDFVFDPKSTLVSTPLEQVFEQRRGVCQDFAHFAIGCLRSMGIPARYVSGYIRTRVPEGKQRLVGADASHAWFSVFCPDLGWVEYDPTNNLMPCEEHITVAVGRDYADVSPVAGIVTGGGQHKVMVSVDVEPV